MIARPETARTTQATGRQGFSVACPTHVALASANGKDGDAAGTAPVMAGLFSEMNADGQRGLLLG